MSSEKVHECQEEIDMSTLLVISVIFLLSLAGAVILFKFFKSSAFISSRKYQAGGAIAGFVIIYGLLYTSYARIEQSQYNRIIDEYRKMKQVSTIPGRVNPVVDHTKILLASEVSEPDVQGRFNIKYRGGLSGEGDVPIYVLGENGWVKKYVDMDTLNIDKGLHIPTHYFISDGN